VSQTELKTIKNIPQHVAIIMDGNGRWAKLQGKSRVVGHKAGVSTVRSTVALANDLGVKAFTLFAFSSENWQRPKLEVAMLMELFMFVLTKEVKRLHRNNIRLRVIGDTSRFSNALRKKIKESEELTGKNTGMVLSIAANYGGRWDIVNAAKELARQVNENNLSVDDITEDALDQYTCLSDLPKLDLLIRTGGDCRISNFLLWQAAYAELYFTDVLWPDFSDSQFHAALDNFESRERRFGQTGEQVAPSK
jgi:undecaprenyl diphosphate synthase